MPGVLLAVLVVVGACATPVPGIPAPAPPTSASPTPAASPRPRDIDVSGILPCELLTPAQQAELGFDSEPRLNSGTDAVFGQARRCDLSRRSTSPALRFRITLVVEYGIERFSAPGFIGGAEPIEIAGYPAVLSPPPPSMPTNCLVAVDISPGQMVGASLADGGSTPGVPLDELCREVPRFATEVVETLLAR
jgi:hypothetical protein